MFPDTSLNTRYLLVGRAPPVSSSPSRPSHPRRGRLAPRLRRNYCEWFLSVPTPTVPVSGSFLFLFTLVNPLLLLERPSCGAMCATPVGPSQTPAARSLDHPIPLDVLPVSLSDHDDVLIKTFYCLVSLSHLRPAP